MSENRSCFPRELHSRAGAGVQLSLRAARRATTTRTTRVVAA